MNIEFNIISHHRSNNVKTVKTLQKCGVDKSHIHIFLNDPTTLEEYQVDNPGIEIVARAGPNAAANRNTVLTHYPDDTYVVICDDDINAFTYVTYENEKIVSRCFTMENWNEVFSQLTDPGAILCFGVGSPMWVLDFFKTNQYHKEINRAGCCICAHLPVKTLFDESFPIAEDWDFHINNYENWHSDIRFRCNIGKMFSNASGGIDYGKYNMNDYKFLVIDKNKDKLTSVSGLKMVSGDDPPLIRMDLPAREIMPEVRPNGKSFKLDGVTYRLVIGNKVSWFHTKNIYGKII